MAVSEYPIKITPRLAWDEARRELSMREKVLHRWASEGKFGMTRELADYRIRCQKFIVDQMAELAGIKDPPQR